jgi:hypothetical protein
LMMVRPDRIHANRVSGMTRRARLA